MRWLITWFVLFLIIGCPIWCCLRINYKQDDETNSNELSDLERETVDKLLDLLKKNKDAKNDEV